MSDAQRFIVVPAGAEPELFVIWDKQEEQVIDVMTAAEVEAYQLDGGL